MALPTLTNFQQLDPPRTVADQSENFRQTSDWQWGLLRNTLLPNINDTITVLNAAREALARIAALTLEIEKLPTELTFATLAAAEANAETQAAKINEIIDRLAEVVEAADIATTSVAEATEA